MSEHHPEQNQDLGIGERVAAVTRTRFINRDGTFNVYRKGMHERGSYSVYHAILAVSWMRFLAGVLVYYVIANSLFTALYLAAGVDAFPEIGTLSLLHRAGQLFFYSVQVITTLGSSPMHPADTFSHIVLSIEAMVGMFGFALGSALMFARFSNPSVRILFSESAVVAPYKEGTGFMVRVINGRSNELVDVRATMTLAMDNEAGKRIFTVLPIERESVLVFPLNWTVVHPITEDSPLYGLSQQDLATRHAEVLLSLTAVDEELSKTVYARTSYLAPEVSFGKKFTNILEVGNDGTVSVNPARISEVEMV